MIGVKIWIIEWKMLENEIVFKGLELLMGFYFLLVGVL